MRIVVLTTETPHHGYFVHQVSKEFPLEAVFVETRIPRPAFDAYHPFEDERDEYERQVFFGGKNSRMRDFRPTFEVGSCNDSDAVARIKGINPEFIIVFGTGKLSNEVISVCPHAIINLHGGDPEKYRGLDTHLWAIYHGDFQQLIATLHHLNEDLDDGAIILQASVPIEAGVRLHQLRQLNTNVCITLALSAIDMYSRHRAFVSRPQRKMGRYYSFMPAALKEICRCRFERYTEGLNANS